jgi:hypothetical protein
MRRTRLIKTMLAVGAALVCWGACAQLSNPVVPGQPRTERSYDLDTSYEDFFTYKWKTSFSYDPWTWGYSKEFAQRFKMPEKWIEPELKGALAVAFRMSTLRATWCGMSGRADNCWIGLDCQMDIYMDGTTQLPWKRPEIIQDTLYQNIQSSDFLDTRGAGDEIRSRYKGTGWNGITGLDNYIQLIDSKGKVSAGGGTVIAYNKKYRGDVLLISYFGSGFCPKPALSGEIVYRTSETFDQISKKQIKEEDAPFMHRIDIPISYLRRAAIPYVRDNKPNEDIIQQIIKNFQDSHKR